MATWELFNPWLRRFSQILLAGVSTQGLTKADLLQLPASLRSNVTRDEFLTRYKAYLNRPSHSIFTFIGCLIYQYDFFLLFLLKCLMCLSSFLNPYFLQILIDFTAGQTTPEDPSVLWKGLSITLGFMLCFLASAFINNLSDIVNTVVKLKLKSALLSLLSKNAALMRLCDSSKEMTNAVVTNMIQVDVERVVELVSNLNEVMEHFPFKTFKSK